jgi:hypothetical protein
MDTKQQAVNQALLNLKNMKAAVTQPSTTPVQQTQQPKQWSYIEKV